MGRRRILVGGTAVLVLVAAVGLASRAHTPAGGGGTRGIGHDTLLEYLLLLIVAASIVVVPFAVYLFASGRNELAESLPKRGNWMASVLIGMSLLSLIGAVVLTTKIFRRHHGSGENPLNPFVDASRRGAKAAGHVRFDWGPVIVVGTMTVLLFAAVGFLLYERRRAQPQPDRIAEELAVALDRTIADLLAEPDPRKAVIAAYAQMERALARARLPRRPAEAPREYLGRVLPAVGAGAESVERLTSLFERAKFSPHDIDAAMKDEAISALGALRDELRSTA
jgi:uncharacterized protein DUF4129